MSRVIRPQMRGPMEGALVEERGIVFTLPVELPPEGAGLILDRIARDVRELAGRVSSVNYAKGQVQAIEADLALVREFL